MKPRIRSIALAICLAWLLPLTSQAFYNPSTGRWLSRDPIEERADPNLYAIANNRTTCSTDSLGLMTFDESCPPGAQRVIVQAMADICKIIQSVDFSCCMGHGLGSRYNWGLKLLCKTGAMAVKCEPASAGKPCARGIATTQTLVFYGGFFNRDGCGWGHGCVVGHEMLHLLGVLHPSADRLFNRVHQCMGCSPYREF
jgi:hypothetical protein